MATVLIVDDSVVDRRLAGGLLEKNSGLTVIYAANGKEALEQLELHVPDIVVTDLQMPEMNGLELVAAVRKEYRLIPIVLMTARGSEEIAVQALQQGAASYVPKRRLAQDLLETVERVMAASGEDRSHARLLNRIMKAEHAFVIENDISMVLSMANYLKQGLAQMRLCEESERLRVCIALEEALLNAFYHGNLEISSALREVDHNAFYELAAQRSREAPYKDRRIYVETRLDRAEARYVIRDDGPGFDPKEVADPRNPDNLDRPSGRGLLLMRTFMDEVSFNTRGNEVTMVKRRTPRTFDAAARESKSSTHNLFTVGAEGEALVVSLTGNVSSFADVELRRELNELLGQLHNPDIKHLVVDFKQVPYFGSTMLEALLTLSNALHAKGKMSLCNVSDVGRDILKFSKFDTLWPVCETRTEALAVVQN